MGSEVAAIRLQSARRAWLQFMGRCPNCGPGRSRGGAGAAEWGRAWGILLIYSTYALGASLLLIHYPLLTCFLPTRISKQYDMNQLPNGLGQGGG